MTKPNSVYEMAMWVFLILIVATFVCAVVGHTATVVAGLLVLTPLATVCVAVAKSRTHEAAARGRRRPTAAASDTIPRVPSAKHVLLVADDTEVITIESSNRRIVISSHDEIVEVDRVGAEETGATVDEAARADNEGLMARPLRMREPPAA